MNQRHVVAVLPGGGTILVEAQAEAEAIAGAIDVAEHWANGFGPPTGSRIAGQRRMSCGRSWPPRSRRCPGPSARRCCWSRGRGFLLRGPRWPRGAPVRRFEFGCTALAAG